MTYYQIPLGYPYLSRAKLYRAAKQPGANPGLKTMYLKYFSGQPKRIVGMTVGKNVQYYGGVNPFFISQYNGGQLLRIPEEAWEEDNNLHYFELAYIYNLDYSRVSRWKSVRNRVNSYKQIRRQRYYPAYENNPRRNLGNMRLNWKNRTANYYRWLNR